MVDYALKLKAMMDGTLAPEDFSHRDHIGVAFEAISAFGFLQALQNMAQGIKDMAERAGAPDKFNATITFAFLSVIAERMAADGGDDVHVFIRANPDLQDKSLLSGRYSVERMTSDLARKVALLPDLP